MTLSQSHHRDPPMRATGLVGRTPVCVLRACISKGGPHSVRAFRCVSSTLLRSGSAHPHNMCRLVMYDVVRTCGLVGKRMYCKSATGGSDGRPLPHRRGCGTTKTCRHRSPSRFTSVPRLVRHFRRMVCREICRTNWPVLLVCRDSRLRPKLPTNRGTVSVARAMATGAARSRTTAPPLHPQEEKGGIGLSGNAASSGYPACYACRGPGRAL